MFWYGRNIVSAPLPPLEQVLVAQWIAHQTSNLGVAGSNPVEYALLYFLCLLVVVRQRYRTQHVVLSPSL